MATTTISPTSQEVNITLRLSDIKKALKLFRGVENVRTSTAKTRTKKLTGIEQALLDVKEGRVNVSSTNLYYSDFQPDFNF